MTIRRTSQQHLALRALRAIAYGIVAGGLVMWLLATVQDWLAGR